MSYSSSSLSGSSNAGGVVRSLGWTAAVFAIVTPMLLVVYAFATSSDPIERAQLVVQGCEWVVMALAVVVILGGAYMLGRQSGAIRINTGTVLPGGALPV